MSPVENISARGFKAVIETNLHSCFLLSKEVRYIYWLVVEDWEGEGGTKVSLIRHTTFKPP